MSALTKIFGTHSDRELKRITPLVDKVESYRDEMKALSDEELRGKTKEYKERLEKGETLDDLLPEAYATVREAASRVLGMEHYRVQIIGGIILHQGHSDVIVLIPYPLNHTTLRLSFFLFLSFLITSNAYLTIEK